MGKNVEGVRYTSKVRSIGHAVIVTALDGRIIFEWEQPLRLLLESTELAQLRYREALRNQSLLAKFREGEKNGASEDPPTGD